MSPISAEYIADPMVPLYVLSALLIAGLGAGVLLFERFTDSSRRVFLLALVIAFWVAPLGLTHAAATPEGVQFWLRIAYLFLPLAFPALYWMVESQGEGTWPPSKLVWWLGGGFSLLNAGTPWLVEGLRSLFTAGALSGWGWLGALYIAFEVVIVGFTTHHLVIARRGALSGAERKEKLLLGAAAAVGSLTMLDYILATDPFRAGLLTPLSLLAAAGLVTLSAVRHRIFAHGQSLAADEVLRTMSDAVLVCDGEGRIRGSNPAAHRLLGRSEAQLRGMLVGEVVGRWHGNEWRGWQFSAESATEELELRSAPGEPVRVSASIEPVRLGARLVGSVLVARDIRDRLEVERALKASERRYMSLFWHNPASLYEFDLEGRFEAVNPVGEELLGRSHEQLRGRPFTEIVDPSDLEKAAQLFGEVLAGKSREYELAILTAAGERREIRGVSIPIFERGEVVGVFGVALDVSEHVRVQRELEVQRSYFADLFESSPEGIVLLEAESERILRVNAEFRRMFGYSSEEAVGRELNDLIVPPDLMWEGVQLSTAAREGGGLRSETVRRRKDGSLVEVSVLARNLPVAGHREQLYGVYRDITDRKETERALREREEELRHAQKLEAVGKLAGGIAHDFNNLLTVINGHAGFALESVDADDPLHQDLLEIEKAGARAASLTQQLLAYSRRQVLHPQPLDPNAVVQGIRGMLGRLIGEHIRVETRLTEEDVRVRADRGQLEQVLVNLVVNARDAMPEGGTLTFETDVLTLQPGDPRIPRWEVTAGCYVRLRVRDTGTGMDADTLEHAFEPFFTTKEQGKGTGLGLATVFGIVKQSGGHVTVVSEPGAGTVCDVILPRTAESTAPAGDSSEAFPAPATPGAPGRGTLPEGVRPVGVTVLVVEDEAAVRKLAVRVLERAGCTVLSAENGARALEVIEAHERALDLVVTDLVMPDMGGRELAEHLRHRLPELPILFMSGYDDELFADDDSHSAFLAKPFTPAALTEHVTAALNRPSTPPSARADRPRT